MSNNTARLRVAARFLLLLAALLVPIHGASAQGQKTAPAGKKADTKPQAPKAADPPSADAETPADDESDELMPLDKMELPTFERLMSGPAVDWIVLTTTKVLVVEPVFPRPGTMDDLKQKVQQLSRRAGDPPDTEIVRRKREAAQYLAVTLTQGEDREYRLHNRFVKEIIYYDDLMLRRIDILLDERSVRRAYELLVALEQRQADWPGIVPRQERLLLTEASVQSDAGQRQHALALLESLHERNPRYPGIADPFGAVCDRLIGQAFEAGDLRESRFFLRRLAKRFPSHAVVTRWSNRLTDLARDLLGQSAAAQRAGDVGLALNLVEKATLAWPTLPEVHRAYEQVSGLRPRLRVGVVDTPRPGGDRGAAIVAPAERRRRALTETPLFFPARFDDKIARYDTRFFDAWTPTDLGHRVLLQMRSYRQSGDSQPPLTSAGLASALAERLDPGNSQFDARFSATVGGLSVRGPFDLSVDFRQVPLRPEALFAFPYQKSQAASNSATSSSDLRASDATAVPAETFPFRVPQPPNNGSTTYVRSLLDDQALKDRRIAELIEIVYESHEKAIQGLLRGEVSLLPQIPVSTVKAFAERSEFFVEPYGLPTTHFLQFHPRRKASSSRALRRALIYGLDRPRLLEDAFQVEAAGKLARLTTAPWPTTSYAYDRFVKPHPFDPALAYSLAKTAEKELQEKLPVLRLWAPHDPEVRRAAARIADAWKKVGVETELLPTAPGEPGPTIDDATWDVAYRVERIVEPLVELWTLLALTNSTETTDLGHLPTWLRHHLLELDRVGDWRTAEEVLYKLHRQFTAEVHMIPLWEIDDHMVFRRTVRDVPERPLEVYQSIERWRVEPWFSKE